MLHEGRVILDVAGPERKGMSVEDLLHMFEKTRGEKLDDDKLLARLSATSLATDIAKRKTPMKELLNRFENKAPEIVFEWHDAETPAKGWVVINSLRGGAAGGGTRMRKGLDRREVESLAKTMEVKFSVSGPAIGGAKSGIDFDPADPRKDGVLRRWYKAVTPLLKTYYGTGGDLNVDEVHEVIPITESYGLWHPQEGVVNGHFQPSDSERIQKVGQLRMGVAKVVEDRALHAGREPQVRGRRPDHRLGRGRIGAALLPHLRRQRRRQARDRAGLGQRRLGRGVLPGAGRRQRGRHHRPRRRADRPLKASASSRSATCSSTKQGNTAGRRQHAAVRRRSTTRSGAWAPKSSCPAPASRLVTREQVDAARRRRARGGVQRRQRAVRRPARSSTARSTSTPTRKVAVIPDFIANCGMARAFAFLMQGNVEISDEAIFGDVSATVGGGAGTLPCPLAQARTGIASTAFEIALDQLV